MKITIEIELEVTHHEYDSGRVAIETACFPGCSQNLLPFMSVSEQDLARQAVEDEVEKALVDKALAIRERRDMRGDSMREIAAEEQARELQERQAQRGIR